MYAYHDIPKQLADMMAGLFDGLSKQLAGSDISFRQMRFDTYKLPFIQLKKILVLLTLTYYRKYGVENWYHDEGYACAQESMFFLLSAAKLIFLLFPGNTFNIEAGKQALRNINSLSLFLNIEVNPRPDENSEGGIIVEIKVKELDQKTAEVNTEWSIVPGRGGYPTLASLQPGGTIVFEHRNLQGASVIRMLQSYLGAQCFQMNDGWVGLEKSPDGSFKKKILD
ncbi:unnamed protein product [Trifolium pratense]|uniref:Uncharacterized protein n=1 Tax=Trifolium pratense TaxID=57577 RepID=A0ACB0M044_TRIPR|nr:unnamed protein product [Trifolium pratense]